MAARGMKTKIALNIAVLVLLSAVITDGLVVVVVQSLLVRQEVDRGKQVLDAVGQSILHPGLSLDSPLPDDIKAAAARITASTHLTTLVVTDVRGQIRYKQEHSDYPVKWVQRAVQGPLRQEQIVVKDVGKVWTGFWWHPQAVIISIPIRQESRVVGAASGISALKPIYQLVSRFNTPILLYVLINTIILTVIGLFRIFKLYLSPIDRIVRQADDYHEDGDLFFAFRQEDNQLNRLSSALNSMLNRIKADKATLQKTVVSLEQANTALKEAQKKIIQTEKMASVGRLASGIAHEIGNPIGIVLGYIDLLNKSDLDEIEKSDFLQRIEQEVERINTVIRQLLDLARPTAVQTRQILIHDILEDLVEVMRMQPLMSGIQLDARFSPGSPEVWANADQLRQVFLNLLLNAADAIKSSGKSEPGRIRIHTYCVPAGDADASSCVRIQFVDNGIGMDAQGLDNLFDPFYTTKEPGKGTGLGLAVSYMIVEGMGGVITAESEAGKGSILTVELPVAKGENEQAENAEFQHDGCQNNEETHG